MVCKIVVAVAVITYNSSKTVVETLNSILLQTYGAGLIELVISDDASVDDTVPIIEQWLDEYGTAFHSVLFFKNPINLGVPGNVNVAWRGSTSEWVKTIAGDDILLPSCIDDNIEYVKKEKNACAVFSEIAWFKLNSSGLNETVTKTPSEVNKAFFKLPAPEQFKKLCIENFVPAPSSFLKLEILEKMGFADERFKLIEDYPLWLKLTDNGIKLHFLDKNTVYYRLSDSLSSNITRLINFKFFNELNLVFERCVYPKLKGDKLLLLRIKMARACTFFVANLFNNRKNTLSLFMMRLIYLVSPKNEKSTHFLKNKIRHLFK